jgi:phospholipid/cholesterol/gamma-HCH transport system substrate-binding protein
MAELQINPTSRQRLRVFSLIFVASALTSLMVYLLVGGEGDLLARRTILTTYMPDAGGIAVNSEVRLSGIRVGVVQKIELSGSLDARNAVRVEMRVLTRYLRGIPDDSQTDITADTLIGNQFIDIAEGKSPNPIKENGTLQSEPVKQAEDRADLIKGIQDELAEVDQILANIESPDSDIGSFIRGEQVYDTALRSVESFDNALRSALDPRTDIGKAFYTREIYDSAHTKLTDIDKTLASIQSGQGSAGHALVSDTQYNDLLQQLNDLRATLADIKAGKGKFSGTLQNDEAWRQADRLLRQIDRTLATFNAGEGGAGKLLANAQLYESLDGALRDLEALMRDLRENPRKYLRLKPF